MGDEDYGLKSKKKKYREKENPVRRAYARQLRGRDKTKRVCEVNPYAEVYELRENLYGIYTESLDGMGDPWIYLICGPEKALLVDTGFGVGDLKGLVRELIGEKEFYVANTHAHFDHAYGNCQFDCVYCHEYEVPRMEARRNPFIWDYLFDEKGKGKWAEFDREDIIPFQPYEIRGCRNHHIFDLGGGHEIELIHTGGHTPGHAMYLDRKNRVLFAGDDACFGDLGISGPSAGEPFGNYATVTGFRNELQELVKRMDEFDGIFPGHGPVDMGNDMLLYILEALEKIVGDPECYDAWEVSEKDGKPYIRMKKMIYQSGYVVYQKNSV